MDSNRNGLAVMLSLLLFTILAVSIRSCNDKEIRKFSRMDVTDQQLLARVYQITAPIRDYKVRTIESGSGVMIVDAGPSLTDAELQTLASELVTAYRAADGEALGSGLFFVRIERDGQRVCHAQTSESGVYVKLDR